LQLPAPAQTAVADELHGGTRAARGAGKAVHSNPARTAAARHPAVRPLPGAAGRFWVSRPGGKTVRRPWCLSCCETLDRDHCDVTRFPASKMPRADTAQRPRRSAWAQLATAGLQVCPEQPC